MNVLIKMDIKKEIEELERELIKLGKPLTRNEFEEIKIIKVKIKLLKRIHEGLEELKKGIREILKQEEITYKSFTYGKEKTHKMWVIKFSNVEKLINYVDKIFYDNSPENKNKELSDRQVGLRLNKTEKTGSLDAQSVYHNEQEEAKE